MTRIAGFSGNQGRNLRWLTDRVPEDAELVVVVTTEPDASILDAASDHGIPTTVLDPDDDSSQMDGRILLDVISEYAIDLVCLDNFVGGLPDTFIEQGPPIFDVHASLLPAFDCADPCATALEAGVQVTGCTIHFVAPGSIRGPIVTQEPIAVYDGDTIEQLTERVHLDGERRAYPRAVRWFHADRLTVDDATGTVSVDGDGGGDFPARRLLGSDHLQGLRYGENPHQAAAVYRDYTSLEPNVIAADQRNPNAKALSYNNYNDADAALNLIKEFDAPAAAVIKHTNPAGCAVAESISEAYDRALRTDPMSAFGGIVALNRVCDKETAAAITESFKEVVVAPEYEEAAISILSEKENLRVLAVNDLGDIHQAIVEKPLIGGRLIQERDLQQITAADLEVVTDREPSPGQIESMLFAWQTIKHVKSNAILFATGTETVGIGMGQVSRVDAVRLAAIKAKEHAEEKSATGAVMASDAFFPFPDGIEVAVEAGIEAVIQPGGSVNDETVIEAADDHDIVMVFTGRRCFRHD